MRREKINIKIKKIKKNKKNKKIKKKSNMRTVRIVFKKKGGRKKTKRKIDRTLKNLNRMKKKEIMNELSKNKIKAHRGSPTSVLRDILFYKKTTGINIVRDY